LTARLLAALLALLLAGPASAADRLSLRGSFTQGGLVEGQTEATAKVRFLKRDVRVGPDGRFVIGFGRDFPATATLTVSYADGSSGRRTLAIERRSYAVQKINGLPSKMVTPSAIDLKRIRREGAEIARVRRQDSPEPSFDSGFQWPVMGIVTGVYGSQRILNGEPRRPHFGIDIAAVKGTPVGAASDGVVALAAPDLYFTGGTVMIDHGHGLSSVYSHLATVAVKVGQPIRRGEPLGTVGSTGRSTGAHLDWRLNWFKQRLDPALTVGPMPAAPKQPKQ
jgi:murein DD-endopeptidase MepM/ murein hydrolase activator NlpD